MYVFFRLFIHYLLLNNILKLRFIYDQIRLILAEATAIGVRLSHASRTKFFGVSWQTAQ